MATRGQFNTKNPTIKRILKEASELASQPSSDFHAEPLESNLFEWHFTLRGPPAPSPYSEGIYHGRIMLPSQYPLRPPSFRFLTPTGRFEVNREICLSISGHHEETWQPAWGIRTALVAMRSFMDTDAKGQVGGLDCTQELRERFAREGRGWRCGVCGKTNEEILKDRKGLVDDIERKSDVVPEELRLAYRDEIGHKPENAKVAESVGDTPQHAMTAEAPALIPSSPPTSSSTFASSTSPMASSAAPVPRLQPARTILAPRVQQLAPQSPARSLAWIDTCIYGVVAALLVLVLRKFA